MTRDEVLALVAAVVEVDQYGCWLAVPGARHGGYRVGRSKSGRRTLRRLDGSWRAPMHRFVYEALVGPIPPGLTLDHGCRRPACCRPEHLEPVTDAENQRRSRRPKLRTAAANLAVWRD